MSNFFRKFYNKLNGNKFILKSGNIKKLFEYKNKLVDETKKLRIEKDDLIEKINNNEKQLKTIKDLSQEIENLKDNKLSLEKEIGKLFQAKQFTINLTELQKKVKVLEIEKEDMNNKKIEIQKDINDLKEEKAFLMEEIENIKINKENLKENEELSIEYIDSLSGLEFERYFAKLLDKLGYYDIQVTASSGDFGIDVLASYDDILYGFQCKLYSEDVGNKAIQEAYSGKEHYGCNVAVVVTNRFFTENARQQSKETKVLLWDRTTLLNKLKEAKRMDFNVNF